MRPGADAWRLEDVSVRTRAVDLRDPDAVAAVVRDTRPDRIFHLAASGAYSWQRDARSIFETNVLGTVALVEAAMASQFDVLVHAGSSSEYGFKDHAPSENELLEPNSDYAVAKAAATMFCRHTADAAGRRLVTLRLYSVYGPWEDPRRFVPTLIEHGLRGELPPLVTPETARDFVYVDDVVEAFVLAAERAPAGAVYNVGTGRQTTVSELVELAREELGIDAAPAWGTEPARTWDTAVWVSDPTRIRDDLGWSASTPIREGFLRTLEWQRARSVRAGA